MRSAIKLDEERCGGCRICYSVCPFGAISFENRSMIKIDVEKCQLCGICSTVCPFSTIEPAYYSYDLLIEKVKRMIKDSEVENLVLMCRGAIPPSYDVSNLVKREGITKFISLRIPCVGRVKTEFYFKAITLGIKKIVVIQCTDGSCRYEKGSQFSEQRILLLRKLLKQFGYEDALTIIENPQQIEYDAKKCVGCDKCVYVCPYNAIEAQPLATPYIHPDKCKGCGLCTVICPHLAMQMKNFESERISSTIATKLEELKEKNHPAILVFCCQWAEFSALDDVGDGFLRENAAVIEIPCFSALNPVHVLQAISLGFDGVLAIVCSDNDCKAKESRVIVEESIRALKFALKKLNLDGKFAIYKTHPRYMESLEEKVESFLEVLAHE